MARALVLPISTPADTDGLDDTARGIDRMRRAADNAGKDFNGLEKDSKTLGSQITITRDRLRKLLDDLNRTGDVGFLKEIRSAKRDLKAFEEAAEDLKHFGRAANDAGDEIHHLTSDFHGLKIEIEHTKTRIKELQAQIAKTGDQGLFGNLKKEESKLRSLVHVFEAVTRDEGPKAGLVFVSGFVQALGGLPMQLKGLLIATVVASVPVVAPLLGAAIAGAVTGLTGLGGIAGGIFAASKSTRVRDAAKGFGETISKEFFGSGDAFVLPVVKALKTLEGEFKALDLGDAFEKVAPFVDELAEGIGALANNFMPGFNEALDRMGPFMHVVGKELGELGHDFGDMLADFSESEGAVTGLVAIFNTLENVLAFTGDAISFLSDRFQEFIIFARNVAVAAEKIFHLMGLVNPEFKKLEGGAGQAADSLERLAGGGFTVLGRTAQTAADILQKNAAHGFDVVKTSAKEAEEKIRAAEDAMRDAARVAFQSENASLRFEEALDRLRDAAKHGRTSLSKFNDEGRDNRRTLQDIVQAAYDARDAIIAEGGGTEEARRRGDVAFNGMIAKARATALALGYPKEVVDALTRALSKVPHNTTAKVSTPGVLRSTRQVQDLQREIKELHDKNVLINVRTRHRIIPQQHGGPVFKGQAYIVGEKRPELFVPETNGRIIPKVPPEVRPKPVSMGGNGAVGGNTYTINVAIGPGGNPKEAARTIVELIQKYEKDNGRRWRTP